MALNHVKKGIRLGMKAADKTAKQLKKEFAPLVKAGHITAKDAREFVSEAGKLGLKAKSRAVSSAKSEAKRLINSMGYMSKAEGDALRRRVAELERKLRAKKPAAKKSKKRK